MEANRKNPEDIILDKISLFSHLGGIKKHQIHRPERRGMLERVLGSRKYGELVKVKTCSFIR